MHVTTDAIWKEKLKFSWRLQQIDTGNNLLFHLLILELKQIFYQIFRIQSQFLKRILIITDFLMIAANQIDHANRSFPIEIMLWLNLIRILEKLSGRAILTEQKVRTSKTH